MTLINIGVNDEDDYSYYDALVRLISITESKLDVVLEAENDNEKSETSDSIESEESIIDLIRALKNISVSLIDENKQKLYEALNITELDDQNQEYLLTSVVYFNAAKKFDLTQRSYHSIEETKKTLEDFLVNNEYLLAHPQKS